MHKDPVNFLYLSFLNPILSHNNSDPTSGLNVAINSLKNKICDTEQQFEIKCFENNINSNNYLGYEFKIEMRKYKNNGIITSKKESD